MNAEQIACEYETDDGRACPYRARTRFTLKQTNAPHSISGEPVRFFACACPLHAAKLRNSLPVDGAIVIEKEDEL
jgi:hypothetical protein